MFQSANRPQTAIIFQPKSRTKVVQNRNTNMTQANLTSQKHLPRPFRIMNNVHKTKLKLLIMDHNSQSYVTAPPEKVGRSNGQSIETVARFKRSKDVKRQMATRIAKETNN